MSPNTLRAYGEALYGPRFQSELARALGVDRKTIERWLNGAYPVPPEKAKALAALKSERIKLLKAL